MGDQSLRGCKKIITDFTGGYLSTDNEMEAVKKEYLTAN